ncbi:MAG: thioesterase family protein [Chloroflexota bacterium]
MTETEKENLLKLVIEEFIPFNKLIAIRVASYDPLVLTIDNRPDLLGNALRQMLHGGVIASLLDVIGGASLIKRYLDNNEVEDRSQVAEALSRTATIDLRIDYLRPGIGERFTATAEIIRPGKRVTVIRMSLFNEQGTLIAVGTGTYTV